MLGLLNDILDMTKIESGEVVMKEVPYPPGEFDKYIKSVIKPLCENKNQKLIGKSVIDDTRIPIIDRMRINQVVFNLLSNAVKYSPVGSEIYYTNEYYLDETLDEPKLRLKFTVKDQGIGMSREFQQVLFEPFSQEGRGGTWTALHSTGLGLAIVKQLVGIMGGTVSVKSELDKGSEFTVDLLLDYIETCDYHNEIEAVTCRQEWSRLTGARALMVEDNEINQEIAKALLEDAGIIVDTADNGQEGLDMFAGSEEGYYDFILTDIRMPLMDGYELTVRVRNLNRLDAASVRIIAMTANAFEEDVRRCLECGMNGHIAKPLQPEEVYGKLLENYEQKN
jgi:CheY-like chemotaxis protein/two-component sensor histidine kinase